MAMANRLRRIVLSVKSAALAAGNHSNVKTVISATTAKLMRIVRTSSLDLSAATVKHVMPLPSVATLLLLIKYLAGTTPERLAILQFILTASTASTATIAIGVLVCNLRQG